MPRGKSSGAKPPKPASKRPIERYEHTGKQRINNPPVGLVTLETDPPLPTHRTYSYAQPVPSVPSKPGQALDYDPHLDPQLVWAGKKEHTSFEVPTVSLHVHERIDPRTIIDAVRKRNGNGLAVQPSLFERREENPPLREAIDFYRHAHGWSNRLIAGDSLLVMNSLLEKEGMAGQVQMVYLDPPYGIKYGSNFQPFVNKRDVKDGKDEDLTQEPEMVKAFRDTWDLGIHSYLTYLRDRLLLSRELLHESGSCFVQISEENVHRVRALMDDVFATENFLSLIYFATTGGFETTGLSRIGDYLVWYGKDRSKIKYRQLFLAKSSQGYGDEFYKNIQTPDGSRRQISSEERNRTTPLPPEAKFFGYDNLASSGAAPAKTPFEFDGNVYHPAADSHWKANYPAGMTKLKEANRLAVVGNTLRYVRFVEDNPVIPLRNSWMDTSFAGFATDKKYVVETNAKVVQRCLLMTTDPGDLVLDPTCGSGTTAYVAEQWGRRWITCDTSRVATTLAKQRLMSANFDYYDLAHPDEGVGSGFRYKTVPHVTLKSIANNPEIREGMTREQIDAAIARYAEQETLYDQPYLDKSRVRVTGPFTLEAVPAPTVKSLDDIQVGTAGAPSLSRSLRQGGDVDVTAQDSLSDFRHAATPLLDASIARSGPTLRHTEWRDELLKTGLRGKGGHQIDFSRVEPLAGTRWLHADAETKGKVAERVVISFGPEYSLLQSAQVEQAWQEARTLIPRPAMIVFRRLRIRSSGGKRH